MPTEARIVVLLFHLLAMLFMAAPLYALVTVNERARFTVPPNYNTDRYLENIIKNQPVRCYAYLTVLMVTGILLVSLLSYVHFNRQPRIESVLDKVKPGEEVPTADRPTLMDWRGRRKRLAGICLFLVLTAIIMGVRVTWSYAPWLAIVFVVAAALFAWRVYRTPLRLGWF